MKNSKKEEKKNNKKIKFAIIFSAISAVVLTILLVILIPLANMRKGTALINNGRYQEAYETLDGNYLKSAKKMKALAEAAIKFEKDNYKEGTRLITSNGGSVIANYDFNGGEGSKEREIITGSNNIRVIPTLEGYKFNKYSVIKFDINTTNYSAELDLKANWLAEKYSFEINYVNDTGGYSTVKVSATYDQPYDFDISLSEGKKLVGWYTSKGQQIPATGIWKYTDIDSLTAVVEWNSIEIGSYPQTQIKENNKINKLNQLTGTLPTSSNSYSWTSYKYYKNKVVADYYWYIDVVDEGKKYRGVYFTEYRSHTLYYESNFDDQYKESFKNNTIYWFEFEPIKWIKFDNNGSYYLMSEYILDCTNYTSNTETTVDKSVIHYSTSTLRQWLNGYFYNLAFTQEDKNSILTTAVSNSTDPNYNGCEDYACETTYDKVFIPSAVELANFIPHQYYRTALGSDYAYCQGLYSNNPRYTGPRCGYWFTRTPSSTNYLYSVGYTGDMGAYTPINSTFYGARPCITIAK